LKGPMGRTEKREECTKDIGDRQKGFESRTWIGEGVIKTKRCWESGREFGGKKSSELVLMAHEEAETGVGQSSSLGGRACPQN